jgi:molybdopterin molybdotransferase
LFGSRGGTLVFGLPGNRVSPFVTFVLFARPALLGLGGAEPERAHDRGAGGALRAPRARMRRRCACRLELREDGWRAHATGPQSSHILTSMVGADALALIPAGAGVAPAGERVTVELL